LPAIGWRQGIGVPPANPGKARDGNLDDGYFNGAPVGGFGAGTIGRTYRGDFARYHLKIGAHKYQTVPANQFALFARTATGKTYAQALWTGKPDTLKSWKWNYPVGAGSYQALYPKSWFQYQDPALPVQATVEQFSPILPNNYRETSYPVALFNWTLRNPSNEPVTVSVMFSWANMVGWFRDFGHTVGGDSGDDFDHAAATTTPQGRMVGVVFDRHRRGVVSQDWDGQFAIAALETPGVHVTTRATFDPNGSGEDVWKTFSTQGTLTPGTDWVSSGEPLAGALAATVTIPAGATRVIPMVLSWDLPLATFGHGATWYRRYTEYFGKQGTHAWAIARNGLAHDAAWSAAIDAWQHPYVTDASKPAWYRGMLFNELYYLADGGTFWENGRVGDASPSQHQFSYMECFDYPYYSTLDVRFYGSMPLLHFWPELEKSEMRTYARSVVQDLSAVRRIGWDGKFARRKNRGALPHDLGNPSESPLLDFNQYNWQDVNIWKDLNTKYVLQVWRDYALTGKTDRAFLRYNWASVQLAMDYLRQFDHDGDGIPENDGVPDQTYDVWSMRGESAYCGSLLLAALRGTEEMARVLGDQPAYAKYHAWYTLAQPNFIKKLWNGTYFRYDTGSSYRDNVMADQLAGQWYADLTGLGPLVPRADTLSALRTVYRLNVMSFDHGRMGAINGISPTGALLRDNEQIHEVWTGTTLGLASFMLAEGMHDEAFTTAKGIYAVVYGRGYWFRTPEAWDETGNYRASMYMRPGAIWAMEMVHPQK